MKKVIALLLLMPSLASAAPYFRLIDPLHPQISAGAFVDPTDPSNSSGGSMLALATHSNRDGCLFPSVSCEDWVPLAVGFAANSGKYVLAIGPSLNLAPFAKSMLLKVFNAATNDTSYVGVKSVLGSEQLDRSDISIAFGPCWAVSPMDNWKGYFRIFSGASWKF